MQEKKKERKGFGKTSTATRLLGTCFPSWCLSVISDSPLMTKIGPSSACAVSLKALVQEIRRLPSTAHLPFPDPQCNLPM